MAGSTHGQFCYHREALEAWWRSCRWSCVSDVATEPMMPESRVFRVFGEKQRWAICASARDNGPTFLPHCVGLRDGVGWSGVGWGGVG